MKVLSSSLVALVSLTALLLTRCSDDEPIVVDDGFRDGEPRPDDGFPDDEPFAEVAPLFDDASASLVLAEDSSAIAMETIAFENVKDQSSCDPVTGPGVEGLEWAVRPANFPEFHAHWGEHFTVRWAPIARVSLYKVESTNKPDGFPWSTRTDYASNGVDRQWKTSSEVTLIHQPTRQMHPVGEEPWCYTVCVQALNDKGERVANGCLKVKLWEPDPHADPATAHEACGPARLPPAWDQEDGLCLPSCGHLGQLNGFVARLSTSLTPGSCLELIPPHLYAGDTYESNGRCCKLDCSPPDWGVKDEECLPSCDERGKQEHFVHRETPANVKCEEIDSVQDVATGRWTPPYVEAGPTHDDTRCCRPSCPTPIWGRALSGDCLPSCGHLATLEDFVPQLSGSGAVGSCASLKPPHTYAGDTYEQNDRCCRCPRPAYGVDENGQCIPSCEQLGVIGGFTSQSFGTPCLQAPAAHTGEEDGWLDAGDAYDEDHCCKPICDANTQPWDDYGIKGGQCRPSCETLVPSPRMSSDTQSCDQLVGSWEDAGEAYDEDHCCKPGPRVTIEYRGYFTAATEADGTPAWVECVVKLTTSAGAVESSGKVPIVSRGPYPRVHPHTIVFNTDQLELLGAIQSSYFIDCKHEPAGASGVYYPPAGNRCTVDREDTVRVDSTQWPTTSGPGWLGGFFDGARCPN